MKRFQVLVVVIMLSTAWGFAQKVKVGYNKSVDFSKYKSYSWQEPGMTETRPMLYATVVWSLRSELEAKGLVRKETGGDLTVFAHGSLDYGLKSVSGFASDSCTNCQAPLVDPMDWAGTPPAGGGGMGLPKGTLEVDLVDRTTNKVVWSGTVVQKLDPDKKQQSLDLVSSAITKLLMEFPPKK